MFQKHLLMALVAILISTPTLAYDKSLPITTCKKLHPTNKTKREMCISTESSFGAAMDELGAGDISSEQYGILQACKSNHADSYSGQIGCVKWFLDQKDAEAVCERARSMGDGSYQTKEACINAELEARQRLGD